MCGPGGSGCSAEQTGAQIRINAHQAGLCAVVLGEDELDMAYAWAEQADGSMLVLHR